MRSTVRYRDFVHFADPPIITAVGKMYVIIVHVIMTLLCVVFKNVLLLEYKHTLFASYLENLWIAAVVCEMILGFFFLVCTMCESKESDCTTHTLAFLMALLGLILQARIFYILYYTDLCESAKVDDSWAEGDFQWITIFFLILLDNIYHYVMLCCRCKNIIDEGAAACCVCLICMFYILPTLSISVANMYTSLHYECKLL